MEKMGLEVWLDYGQACFIQEELMLFRDTMWIMLQRQASSHHGHGAMREVKEPKKCLWEK